MESASGTLPPAEPTWIGAAQLRDLVPVAVAVDALEAAWRDEPPQAPPRSLVAHGDGELLVMPAAGKLGVGAKLLGLQPSNPSRGLPLIHGVYVFFEADTLVPAAFIDGAELTRIRTPAVSALAARFLARRDASRLVVFGAGVQASAHVAAMRAVRPIVDVCVVDPASPEAAAELASELRATGLRARVGDADAVEQADLVCTCTTASTPVFDGARLPPGVHVNAIGSYQPETREIDGTTLQRALVVVEEREAVFKTAGDLALAFAEGALRPGDVAGDLSALVRGAVARDDAEQITVFKSVGLASEDLVVAAAALARLRG